jgi:hypothetical protein
VGSLDIGQTAPLVKQFAEKPMRGVRAAGSISTFRVRIRSVTPESGEAAQWRKGELPVPAFGE